MNRNSIKAFLPLQGGNAVLARNPRHDLPWQNRVGMTCFEAGFICEADNSNKS